MTGSFILCAQIFDFTYYDMAGLDPPELHETKVCAAFLMLPRCPDEAFVQYPPLHSSPADANLPTALGQGG